MGDLTNPTLQAFAMSTHPEPIARAYPGDLFLLNPTNQRFIEGRTRQVALQHPAAGYGLLFLIPFLVVGLAVMVWVGSAWSEWSALSHAGVNTIAEISDKRVSNDNSNTYYFSYRFSTADMIYAHEQSVSPELYNRAEIGAKVNITYLQDNPKIVVLARTSTPPWFPLGFGLFWNLLVWPIFISMFLSARRNHLLEQRGHVINGQVATSSGSIDGDGDYVLKLDYSFYSPTSNQIISGRARQTRTDLKGNALPTQGALIAILYRNDKHHKPL